jgi:sporulation integral membrane protein YtvI
LPDNKHARRGLFLVYFALGVLVVWVFLRFALPWLLPFIAAFAISRLIEPAVRLLTKRFRFRRGASSALCTVVVFAAAITLLTLGIGRVIYELAAFAKDVPALLGDMSRLFSAVSDKLRGYIIDAPEELQDYLTATLEGLSAKSADMLAALSRKILSWLSSAASGSPRFFVFIFTCGVSAFFISSGYGEVTGFLLRQIPARHHAALLEFRRDLVSTLGRWVRAQLMLSGVTFVEMSVAFYVMRIEFAILLALVIALIDALPILGAGAVLVPWAVVSLAGGDVPRAVTLLVTFCVIIIVRRVLEPKLVGGQLGLPPIATLVAMYVGFCAVGILGMALFPIGLIMLKHLNDKGYIRLWRN